MKIVIPEAVSAASAIGDPARASRRLDMLSLRRIISGSRLAFGVRYASRGRDDEAVSDKGSSDASILNQNGDPIQ